MLSTAQTGAIITSSTPAFMVLFARLLLNERLTWKKGYSICFATLGVFLIVGFDHVNLSSKLGGISLLIAALTWALMSALVKLMPSSYQRPKPPLEKVQAIFHMLLFHQQGIQFVAEKDGKLVGFATLYFTYSTTRAEKITVMNDLYVVDEMRGKGISKDLFQACESYTRENGFYSMSWETHSTNKRAQRFYEKMGGKKADWVSYSI